MPDRPHEHGGRTDQPPRGADTDVSHNESDSAPSLRERVEVAAFLRGVPLPTILTTVAVVVVAGLLLLLLWVLRSQILYIVVACFLVVLLSPPVALLQKRGLSRGAAASIVFILGLSAFAGLVYLFSAPLISGVTRFSHQIPTLVKQAQHGRGTVGHLITRFHLQRWVSQNASKLTGYITKSVKPAQALSVGAAAASTIIGLATIAVLSFFLLLEAPSIWRGILGAMSPGRRERVDRIRREVTRSVFGYMAGNALTSIIAGLIVFITLMILGVPFPLLLGLWVALVDLLPLVGGLLAGVPTVLIALLHSPFAALVMLIVFLVYQQIENHILNPVIMSRTVRLSPLWVLLAVLVGAKLGSQVGGGLSAFIGALIGIPAGGAIQVIVREIRRKPGPPEALEVATSDESTLS